MARAASSSPPHISSSIGATKSTRSSFSRTVPSSSSKRPPATYSSVSSSRPFRSSAHASLIFDSLGAISCPSGSLDARAACLDVREADRPMAFRVEAPICFPTKAKKRPTNMSGRRHLRQGFVFRPPHAKRAMAETTEATEAAARVSEVEALFKIHGVDQRSSELLYAHPALGGDASPVRLRQDGSDSAAFVPGTSTVIWPCAYSLGDFLCDATAAVRASDDPRRDDPAHAASPGRDHPGDRRRRGGRRPRARGPGRRATRRSASTSPTPQPPRRVGTWKPRA